MKMKPQKPNTISAKNSSTLSLAELSREDLELYNILRGIINLSYQLNIKWHVTISGSSSSPKTVVCLKVNLYVYII